MDVYLCMILLKKNILLNGSCLEIKSYKNPKLSYSIKRDIINLKKTYWKFSTSSQLNWFKKNIHPQDVHNCLFLNNKLIGYTLLRNRKMLINDNKKKYFLIDTVTISKEFRMNNFGNLLMEFNNNFIKKKNYIGFLLCKKKIAKFYINNNWKNIKKNKLHVDGKKSKLNGMYYNLPKKLQSELNKNSFYIQTN